MRTLSLNPVHIHKPVHGRCKNECLHRTKCSTSDVRVEVEEDSSVSISARDAPRQVPFELKQSFTIASQATYCLRFN